jgi:hypothetical protein
VRSTLGWALAVGVLAVILVSLAGQGTVGPTPPVAAHNLAPEIAGVDADGKPMRLSDFRGKVVAVDFWASW